MLSNHRPSILRRKLKPPSLNNVENGEKEFQEQQAYWQHKSDKARETEERFRRSIYPDANSKQHDQAAVQEVMERQLQEVQQRRVAEEVQERGSWMPEQMTADHPWAHKTDPQIQEHMAAIQRRIAREAASDNLHMVQSRRDKEAQERNAEREKERATVVSEETWWNRGASSDRWLPPERRVKPGYSRGHASSDEAPFAWAEEPGRGASRRQSGGQAAQGEKKSYPWSWEEREDAAGAHQGPRGASEDGKAAAAAAPAQMEVKVYPWNWEEPPPRQQGGRSRAATPEHQAKPYPWTWET